MASAQVYIDTGKRNLNKGWDYTIEQIIQSLGGTKNPTQDNWVPYTQREVTDPKLRNINEYLNELGAQDYQYQYDKILAGKQAATQAAYEAEYAAQNDATNDYYRAMANNQETAADTIRSQYAQAIQSGISKGAQQANILSTILGNSQTASDEAQKLAEQRYQIGKDQAAAMIKDQSDALSASNAAYETLMG